MEKKVYNLHYYSEIRGMLYTCYRTLREVCGFIADSLYGEPYKGFLDEVYEACKQIEKIMEKLDTYLIREILTTQ